MTIDEAIKKGIDFGRKYAKKIKPYVLPFVVSGLIFYFACKSNKTEIPKQDNIETIGKSSNELKSLDRVVIDYGNAPVVADTSLFDRKQIYRLEIEKKDDDLDIFIYLDDGKTKLKLEKLLFRKGKINDKLNQRFQNGVDNIFFNSNKNIFSYQELQKIKSKNFKLNDSYMFNDINTRYLNDEDIFWHLFEDPILVKYSLKKKKNGNVEYIFENSRINFMPKIKTKVLEWQGKNVNELYRDIKEFEQEF